MDRANHRQRGAALVEAVLLMPLLLILLFGIVDVGRVVYTKITLHDAAQEGSVYGAYNPGNATQVQTRVVESMDSLSLATSDVTITCPNPPGGVIRVTVQTDVSMFTPLFTGWTVTLSSSVDGDVLTNDATCSPSA
jgi:Flp pilus assembly protein TadG